MTFQIQPNRSPLIQAKLSIGRPDDKYEQEADAMADQVMQMPQSSPPIQRKCEDCEDEQLQMKPLAKIITPVVQKKSEEEEELIQMKSYDSGLIQTKKGEASSDISSKASRRNSAGSKLPDNTNQFMSSAFGADFSNVNIHTGSNAVQMNRSLNAKAFTHGNDVYFNKGEYSPESGKGKHLLAHELTHVIQQRGIDSRIQRRWDPSPDNCTESDKWIERIVIEQEIPQSITLHWSDGSVERDECSTGKGHCCVPDSDPTASACSVAESQRNGSNCTPITERNGYSVQHRDRDHNGISYWSEFVPSRGIAMHTYTPVDGTALSHGCVRLNEPMAKRIYCNIRQHATMVQVMGFARPQCDNSNVISGWENDFASGGVDLSALDNERSRGSVRETRRLLNEAFGRELTVEEIRDLSAEDIPRCGTHRNLPSVEEARVTANESTGSGIHSSNNEVTIPQQILVTSGFDRYLPSLTTALSSLRSIRQARRVIRSKGTELWEAAVDRSRNTTPNHDDRPIYWARLQMSRAIRQWDASFSLSEIERNDLIHQFELSSRGMTSANYTRNTDLKILISGFDPFYLDNRIGRGNPSGVVALAMDGEVLRVGGVSAEVQAVIFPVRFEDFDDRMVESFFRPYMLGDNKVDMIMTISQGGSEYEVERYAGRNRSSGDFPDNQNQTQGSIEHPATPIGLSSEPQALTTTLPDSIRNNRLIGVIEDRTLHELDSDGNEVEVETPTGATVTRGSGQGYLSNEIFYRAALLRNANDPNMHVGHLHIPRMPSPSGPNAESTMMASSYQGYINQIKRILETTIPDLHIPSEENIKL